MTTERWTCRPAGSTWGDFGPDDQLGRLNLLTPEKVRQGIAEVREGLSFCLSLPLDLPGGNVLNPRRFPPVLSPTGPEGEPRFTYPLGQIDARHTDVTCDDKVLLCLQYSTQWDALSHFGGLFDVDGDGRPEAVFYNGWRAGADISGPRDYLGLGTPEGRHRGARALGIETMAAKAIQGRAVLVDLEAHYGRERRHIGHAELAAVMAADGVSIEPGDMLCLHTGFAQCLVEMGGSPTPAVIDGLCAVLDGRDEALRGWIRDSGIAALIADNYAVEGLPAKDGGDCRHAALPLHELCLFHLGVPLGELWHLTDLARHLRGQGRSRFFLTAPPLRLPGAVGSPVTPVATV